ncbi:MAG: FtsW/RodA/SpoVE family cell cycle protein [Lachnospiraceae bacterium]|nr:FtsW/RodA/SpoVE family cell cycle protein [Lachnospiraceae bacterium]
MDGKVDNIDDYKMKKKRIKKTRRKSGLNKVFDRYYNTYDYLLLCIIIVFAIFGTLIMYSAAGEEFMIKHARWYAIGFGMMILLALINPSAETIRGRLIIFKNSEKNMIYHYFPTWFLGIALILQVLVLFVGVEINYSRRWFQIGSITIQPAEISKIAVIVALAYLIALDVDLQKRKVYWIIFGTAILLDFVLIAKENLSSGLIVLMIAFGMILTITKRKWIFPVLIVVAVLGFLVIKDTDLIIQTESSNAQVVQESGDYRSGRLKMWKKIDKYEITDYEARDSQVIQGLCAIASGGMFGKGIGQGIQKFSVPENYNDMIFVVIFEELGIVGAMVVMLLYILMIWRIAVIGIWSQSKFQSMICFGVMLHMMFQVMLNLAVVTNFFPNTGISLPLLSYGGTATVLQMFELGMVLLISKTVKHKY